MNDNILKFQKSLRMVNARSKDVDKAICPINNVLDIGMNLKLRPAICQYRFDNYIIIPKDVGPRK